MLYLVSAIPYSQFSLRTYNHKACKPLSNLLKRVRHHNDFAGATAYVIRPQAAKAMIEYTTKTGVTTPDGHLHRAFNEGLLGIVVMTEDKQGFMYNNHWSEWNHIHDPEVSRV